MKTSKRVGQFVSLLVVAILLAGVPVPAQRRAARTPAQRPPAQRRTTTTTPATQAAKPSASSATPTRQPSGAADVEIALDELLAADSYTFYAEVRAVGQLVRTGSVMELLEPMRLLGQIPPEMSTLIDFAKSHADTLANSRLMIAANPAIPTLPQGVIAIELPSPEAARRFVPELRTFLRAVVPAKTSGAGAGGDAQPRSSARGRGRQSNSSRAARSAPPFHIKRAGSLVIASDKRFSVQALRPEGSEAFSQQERFQTARNHFPTDSVFIYVDIETIERMSKEERESRMQEFEKMQRTVKESGVSDGAELPGVMPEDTQPPMLPTINAEEIAVANENGNANVAYGNENLNANTSVYTQTNTNNTNAVERGDPPPDPPVVIGAGEASESEARLESADPSFIFGSMIFGSALGGMTMPSVAGTGLSLDGDDVIIRALLINKTETKASLIPFVAILKPGPPLAPDASNVVPADTDILVNLSLDLPLIYQTLYEFQTSYEKESGRSGGSKPPAETESKSSATDDKLAAMEKLLGFSIKEDLLPALGNEIAVGVPGDWIDGPSRRKKESTETAPPGLMILISLRDKEKVESILPRALSLIGMASPGAAAATEKYKGVEIFRGSGFALAFIGNFLVAAPEVATLHRVADAYSSGQTLAASPEYRKSTNWLPRQSLGQAYVSGGMLKRIFAELNKPGTRLDDETKSILARYSRDPEAITHALTGEGVNHFHEIHLPKSLITTAVAAAAADAKNAPLRSNEYNAMYALRSVVSAEMTYKETKGKGSFGTLEDLVNENLLYKSVLESSGYSIKLTVAGDKFEVTAIPTDYGKSGFRSFYIDASGVLRGGDKGGQQASASDEPADF